jgi:hypothetical protein
MQITCSVILSIKFDRGSADTWKIDAGCYGIKHTARKVLGGLVITERAGVLYTFSMLYLLCLWTAGMGAPTTKQTARHFPRI